MDLWTDSLIFFILGWGELDVDLSLLYLQGVIF